MTTHPHESVLAFGIADRLRKAREVAGLGQRELAEATGISRSTVANYEAGTYPPKRPALLSWSMATGVPLEWLQTGQWPEPDPNGGGTAEDAATVTAFDLRKLCAA